MPHQLDKIVESLDKFASNNAFCIADRFYSYADLKKRIAGIQQLIHDAALKGHSNIGILTYDDLETYASVFAVLFSGHAFVPINPLHPIERNTSITSQAEIKILLSSQDNSDSKRFQTENTRVVNTSSALSGDVVFRYAKLPDEQNAYILFTSGSTGVPKGVPLTVRNLDSFLSAFFDLGYKTDAQDKFIQMFDLTFDLSIMSYMAPLCIGSSVYTVPFDAIKYTHVYELLEKYDLTFALLVPSILTHLRPYFPEIKLDKMRYCLFCGEALYEDVTLEWAKSIPNAVIQNVYGPTEATIFCMTYDVNRNGNNKSLNGILSIGKPMKNMDSIIADDNGHPAAMKEKGELCLTGAQVTPGYWKNELKNKESFFTFEGKRYYRTGDLCFCDETGDYYYSGRVDFQVKIGGYRVELSEIEHHAREFLKSHAVVAHVQQSHDMNQILLFIENYKNDFDELHQYLKTKLPAYMLPAKIISVDVFPLNPNGKIDRKALMNSLSLSKSL